jgi:hypothetical protein
VTVRDVAVLRFVLGRLIYFIQSVFMSNDSPSPMSRRGLLQLGILAGMLGAAGCGAEGTVTPTAEKGNRARLDKMEGKAKEALAKKKR